MTGLVAVFLGVLLGLATLVGPSAGVLLLALLVTLYLYRPH